MTAASAGAPGAALELLTVGRVSVDLYASEPGVGWRDVAGFTRSVGGSPTNVAVAAARLGRRAAVLTKVGDDPFGEYVRAKLQRFGVDTSYVGTHPSLRTPLAFCVLDPPEDPPLLFYREPTAPDLTILPGEVDEATVSAVPAGVPKGVSWKVRGRPSAPSHSRASRKSCSGRTGR